MGVQGARKFVCCCAGEPQRCLLKDCVNSGLEDEARVSHKDKKLRQFINKKSCCNNNNNNDGVDLQQQP
jgi:hypothetical protein